MGDDKEGWGMIGKGKGVSRLIHFSTFMKLSKHFEANEFPRNKFEAWTKCEMYR